MMVEFHTNERMVRGANSSFLFLIPKRKNPSKVSDYMTISLVGCIFKVIPKVLANRLKKAINKIISDTQSTFITGRQILNVILVANKIVVDEERRRKKEVVIFKVDFEKAFDCVDWKFWVFLIEKMGFPLK